MNQFRTWRWLILPVMLAVLLLGASGCGGARATSWTGMTVVGERLYAADLQQVQVLNTTDGESVWAFPKDIEQDNSRGFFYVIPTVSDGYIIAASYMPPRGFLSQANNVVLAINIETGAELWSFDKAAGQYIEGGALDDGVFVIGNSDGKVYGLDVESGSLKWELETDHRVWSTPLIAEGTVYVSSMDHRLYALNLQSGAELWRFEAGGAFASTPALWDGMLYIGAFDDTFYAIDAATGTQRWSSPGENWFWGNPVAYEGVIYTVDVSGNMYALDAQSGAQIWREKLSQANDAPVRAGPALTEDGRMLLIGSENGKLYALDTASGTVKWSVESQGQVLSPPVISGTVVYQMIMNSSQRIRALHVDNGYEIWIYPRETEEQQ